MASALLRERLPPGCEIGVTSDGRVFFVNDHNQSTSWLHPATGEPVLTGLQGSADLPKGWEQDSTLEGHVFYVDHSRRLTTFVHPQEEQHHHQPSAYSDRPQQPQSPSSPSSPSSPTSPNSTLQRDNFKRGTFKQRSVKAPTAKRNPNSSVVKRGWLYKLESGGLSKSKTWKKRWAILADFALFLYKSEEEVSVVSSILLPGYKLNPCTQEDNIKRNFVFKVEHENTKTVYLATDDSPEFVLWMSLLRQASMMNGQSGFQREANNNYRHYPSKDGSTGNRRPDSAVDNNSMIHNGDGGSNYSPSSNPSFQKLQNFRAYDQQDPSTGPPGDNQHFSQDGQSPSYHGYNNDPAPGPMDPQPPRVGGVYPFILQQGQRQSYVSMGSSNRDSYVTPHNDTRGFPNSGGDSGRVDNHPPPNNQRWQDDLGDRHRTDAQLSYEQNQQRPLRDGFAPDSVRSSLAQVDQRNSYAIGPQMDRDHIQQYPSQAGSLNDYVDLSRPHDSSQNNSFSRNQPHDNSQNNSFSKSQNRPHDISQNDSFSKNQSPHRFNPQDPDTSRQGSFYNWYDPMTHQHNQSHDSSSHRNNNPDWIQPQHQNQQQSQPPLLPQGDAAEVRSRLSQSSHDIRARYPQQDPQGHRGHRGHPHPEHDRRSFASTSSAGYYHHQQQQPTQHRHDNHSSPKGSDSSFRRDANVNNEAAASRHQRNDSRLSSDQRGPPPSHHSSFSPDTHIPNQHPNNQHQYPYEQEQYPSQSNPPDDHHNPHTYVNFPSRQAPPPPHLPLHNTSRDSSLDQPPSRPPYPAEMRSQIVEEIAKTQTPVTQKDFLISATYNQQRMQQPSFFQYPSPRDGLDSKREVNLQSSSPRQNIQRDSEPNSRFSTASRGSHSSRGDRGQGHGQKEANGQDTFSRNMMDPEAQKLRVAYERVHSLRLSPDKVDNSLDSHNVQHWSKRSENDSRLSSGHRSYKSQDELDEVGKTPPPTGSYHKIREDSEDLYMRGSAFRPPSSMSGQSGSDSLLRMKRKSYSTTALSGPAGDDSDKQDVAGISRASHDHSSRDERYNSGQERSPYNNYYNIGRNDLKGSNRNYSETDRSHYRTEDYSSRDYRHDEGGMDEEDNEKKHPFFDPYGNAKGLREWRENRQREDQRPILLAAPPRRKAAPIQTVKEDPDMPDKDVLETDLQKVAAKNPLNGPRLRMSISAADLIGKTHDELVLLLIQLRRNQSALDQTRGLYRHQIDKMRPAELEYRRQMHQFGVVPDEGLHNTHRNFSEARAQMEEIENKLEVYRPIINLLDNMVTMGSLYGGDNLMLATQYRKHLLRPDQYQPAKKMLEFSRQQQEERLVHGTHEDIKQLSKDEVDLEDKIDRLNEVDRLLQEQSFKVSSFKEDKELMERALFGILKQQDQNRNDPREMRRLTQQQRNLEKEISRVTQQLAEASKELEETTAENNKLEHEIALLRTKVHGELSRSRSAPSLASENIRTKMKMEKELAKVQDMMQGLNQKGAKLSQAMNTLRRSSSGSHIASAMEDFTEPNQSYGSYLQTDLDSGEQVDLATSQNPGGEGYPAISHHRQNAADDWDNDRNDEDTKKFFGLLPRDKPKGQTVRDVKRLSEARKDKEKRRDDEFGEEIKLRVSNVDNEVSSIIHARIAKDTQSVMQSTPGDPAWESGQPLYENLPRYGSMPALADNNNNNKNGNNNAQSAASSRRSSIILLTPKPFVPYQDKSARPFRSELALNLTNNITDNGYNQSDNTAGNDTSYFNKGKNYNAERPYHSQDLLSSDSHTYSDMKYGSDGLQQSFNQERSYDQHVEAQQPQSEGQFYARPATIIPKGAPKGESPITVRLTGQTESAVPGTNGEKPVTKGYSRVYAPRPRAKTGSDLGEVAFNTRKPDRGRYMTISSSQPLKMESNSLLSPTIHSSAGDLILNRSIDDVPDIVKSSQGKVDQIDGDVIDREILSVPDKVLIPERYDAEADAEDLTEDEKVIRQERSERIRRVLTSQSVMSLSQPDVSKLPVNDIHSRVKQEKKERAHFLALNQELARQVTQQSKKQAAERRKTWSGAQFADAKKQYEQEMLNSSAIPLRSPDPVRKRSELTLRNL